MKVSFPQWCPTLQPCGLTVALQVPLFVNFARQEYWRGLPFPSPGDLPEIKPGFPAMQLDSLPSKPPGKPQAGGILEVKTIHQLKVIPWLVGRMENKLQGCISILGPLCFEDFGWYGSGSVC